MLLKRVYDHSGTAPVLDHVKVLRAKGNQNFSTRFIENQLAAGLLSMANGEITLHTVPELKYRILRKPGYYCCHDNEPLSDGGHARKHLAEHHQGKKSPDACNPAGYRRDNFYACELIEPAAGATKKGSH